MLFSFCIITALLSLFIAPSDGQAGQCRPWTVDKKNRIFVLTDIANEPDDTMSMVRLLTHSDLYHVEALVAITSFWLPNVTRPDQIHTLVDAYGEVRGNLQSHSNSSFPTTEYLKARIASGPPVYGSQAISELEAGGNLTSGAQMLVETVDASSDPLYVQIWGGSNTLATALWYVNRTRSADELSSFVSKLRVYSISDQDDTGPWIRQRFPDMRFIASRDGFNQYETSAWRGISGSVDAGGPDDTIVHNAWLHENIQLGPLGKHYPDIAFIMEGDSPSLMYNFQNGLGNPEYPSWGSWGGRYVENPLHSTSQFADAVDVVVGLNNETYTSNHATIWRWRDAFQNEFAARIQWTLAPNSRASNATHPPIVVVNGSCGSSHLEYSVKVGDTITLDASPSYSPDSNADLSFTWFQYLEPSSYRVTNNVPALNFTYPGGSGGRIAQFEIPEPESGYCVDPQSVSGGGVYSEAMKCTTLHVVVRVKDMNAKYPIERYRRVLLHMQPYSGV
ncbi:DUF1593-domain-containing protein [Trematosphaeria pertusa]|uniref:DUF1593-domain-containing protein n=1 Tax=Trematosphaeria pertusa TaxID=390896 RepID=A0A6A6IPU8_9PLEO|nr:DUF1593-domain-containing protein [Trematosphaeria pertusa]KAF2251610.1 DUF1593-domain-containing protein [Trematosphaeria pertusa]